jgi:hypothetical protein
MKSIPSSLTCAAACSLAFALSSSAQISAINWLTTGGGGAGSGGSYSICGTIGQHDAGVMMSGASFSILGGFWTPGTSDPGPRLAIRRVGLNGVILSWPNPSTGYILQQTVNLSAPGGGWMDVTLASVINGSNKEIALLATGRSCMFRLRKP